MLAKLKNGLISAVVVLWSTCATSAFTGGDEANEAMGCVCTGSVGNIDCDYADIVSIEDLQLLADHLFYDFARLPSREEANCSGDPEGVIDIVDLQVLVDHMFGSFAPLPDCPGPPNSPPDTRILGQHGERFINAVDPGSISPGIDLHWVGSDAIDHPYYPPPFEFEWRLFGPYDDTLFEKINDSFIVEVFLTNDHRVFRLGLPPDTVWDTIVDGPFVWYVPTLIPTSMVVCDTTYLEGQQVVSCDTVLIDTISHDNEYGTLDTLFDIENPAFVGKSTDYDRVAAASFDGMDSWVYATGDTVYDVFSSYPTDSTTEMNFIFWVRSRDPIDSSLYDPVPDFQIISVIEAKKERDVLVIDVGQVDEINTARWDSTQSFWTNAINAWQPSATTSVEVFLPQRDFIRIGDYQNDPDFLLLLMKYKVMVLIQDAVTSSIFSSQEIVVVQSLYDALRSGVNTWLAMRTPLGNFAQGADPGFVEAGATYRQFFGVERLRYSGWSYYARRAVPQERIEDFIGASPEDLDIWPELTVDSSLLHRRYTWSEPYYQWVDSLAALPGVGFCELLPEAEVLYTYNSLYGSDHFLGAEFSYQGLPVMHRLENGFTRTAHSLFTPLAFEDAQAQVLVNRTLTWLCYGEEP